MANETAPETKPFSAPESKPAKPDETKGKPGDNGPLTHDEAEAIGILDHYLHTLKIVPPWRETHPFLPPCG